ncbi:MAG: type IV pilus secretin PilQ [Acidobacteria bacterium]|nr:type IV pilus secretin PilQ [Acidobacteriota bacterium]
MNARLSSLLVAGGVALVAPASLSLYANVGSDAPVVRSLALQGHEAQATQVHLGIPGLPGQPRVEVLTNPHRVVIDVPGVLRGSLVGRKDLQGLAHPLILKARLAQFSEAPAPITRLVLEVAAGTQVAVHSSDSGLTLDLMAGKGAVQARFEGLAASPAAPAPMATAPSVKVETEVVTAKAQPASVNPLADLPGTPGSFNMLPRLAASTLMPVANPEALQEVKPPVTPAAPAPVQATAPKASGSGRTIGDRGQRYSGAKMTIDLQNTDLVNFLRIIAETGKLNLVVDNDVQGTYNFKFTDTPWDQILDVILKNAGLGKEIDNGVLRVAKTEKLQREEEDRKKLDEAKALAGDLQTITRPLSYAKVADVAKITKDMLTKRGSVIVDDRTNTLIITDLPSRMGTLDELIQTLDVQIQQVQIEARVVEAAKGWDREFGVKWPTSNAGDAKISIVDSTGKTSDAPWLGPGPSWNSASAPRSSRYDLTGGFAPGKDGVTTISNPAGEFWFSFLSNRLSINAILQALEKDSLVKVVSSPKVVTQNNKKATILSGEKVPYPAQQGGAAGGAITVQFVDANLKLEVTPQITSEGTIIMDLNIEKAQADFSRTVLGTPTIQRKSIETQVLVRDGGTAVLGGVYITNNQLGSTGVPFLKDIPILGWLFKNKITKEDNAELLIFITPRIVRQ